MNEGRLNTLLDAVISQGGSDLHLSPGSVPIVRIGAQLLPLSSEAMVTPEETKAIAKGLLTEERMAVFVKNGSIDFSYAYKDFGRFRINAYRVQSLVMIAMRYIPKEIRDFSKLNLPSVLETFTTRQQGFFLVVGPVGQGKSTTLAAMIERINQTRAEHIITVEDPIEYVYRPAKSLIHQREVYFDVLDFRSALQAALREDINVLMVGEMRDYETISAAVTAAETGHLVFSTLHTNNAAQTIDRIIDSFPGEQQSQIRVQLAGSLVGIFSQRLVPRISGGLIPAYELLINNNAVANLIREGRTYEITTVIETSAQDGMISLDRSLAELVKRGEIAAENAIMHALDPETFERYL